MRLLIQRVKEGHVDVAGKTVASIGKGLVVLAGFGAQDTPDLPGTRLWDAMIEKMLRLRIFPDEEGRMNRELTDIGGEIILVSQFTSMPMSVREDGPLSTCPRRLPWPSRFFGVW